MEGFKRGLKRSSEYYPKIQFDAFLVAVKVTKSRARKFLDLSTVRRKGWEEVFFHPISIFTLSSLCSLIRQLISRWQPLVTATPFQSRVRPFLLSVTGCQRNTFPSEHSSIIEFAHFDINEITFNKIFESWAQYMMQVRRKTNSLTSSQVGGIRRGRVERWNDGRRFRERKLGDGSGEERRGSETRLAKVISAPCCLGRVKL